MTPTLSPSRFGTVISVAYPALTPVTIIAVSSGARACKLNGKPQSSPQKMRGTLSRAYAVGHTIYGLFSIGPGGIEQENAPGPRAEKAT